MKRLGLVSLLIIICSTSYFAQTPNEKKAKAILDEVSAQFKSYSSMEVEFSFSMVSKKDNIDELQEGKIYTKGEKYNLSLDNRNIISDGTTVWSIMTDISEITINNPAEDEDAINPTSIFTVWEKGFKYKFIKEAIQKGKTVEIIDLTPIKGKAYYKIRLIIDKSKKQLISSTIHEKSGTTYTYIIKRLTPNKTIEESKFTFKTSDYPDADIIDMR